MCPNDTLVSSLYILVPIDGMILTGDSNLYGSHLVVFTITQSTFVQ